MKYAILSDLHANESALRRVLKDAVAQGVRRFVCLGDVVGYGPLPAETLNLLRQMNPSVIAGNHDDAVSGRIDPADFIDLAGDAVRRHREALGPEARHWLGSLAYTVRFGEAVGTHGDFTNPPAFFYIENEEDAAANFRATTAPLLFFGHTHVPALFLTGQSGKVYQLTPQDFTLEEGKRYLVNPGSVGYPREADGVCRSSYVIYDADSRSVYFRYLPFSVASVMQRGRTPRRLRLLAGAVFASAGLAGGAALLLAPDAKVVTQTEVVEKVVEKVVTRTVEKPAPETDPALELDSRTLSIPLGHTFLRANVRLEKESVPVQLKVLFKDAQGKTTGMEATSVKTASKQRWKIPAGTATAVLALSRIKAGDQPKVASFAPATEAPVRRPAKASPARSCTDEAPRGS